MLFFRMVKLTALMLESMATSADLSTIFVNQISFQSKCLLIIKIFAFQESVSSHLEKLKHMRNLGMYLFYEPFPLFIVILNILNSCRDRDFEEDGMRS